MFPALSTHAAVAEPCFVKLLRFVCSRLHAGPRVFYERRWLARQESHNCMQHTETRHLKKRSPAEASSHVKNEEKRPKNSAIPVASHPVLADPLQDPLKGIYIDFLTV